MAPDRRYFLVPRQNGKEMRCSSCSNGTPNYPEHLRELHSVSGGLQLGGYEIRQKFGLEIWEGFMCHRCAYMNLECDLDRALARQGETP